MAPAPDHYATLGVAPGSGDEALRRAYRDLARRLHPDRHGQSSPVVAAEAARRMQDVNAAWTVLSDPVARADYDRRRRAAGGGQAEARAAATGPAATGTPRAAGPPVLHDAPALGPFLVRSALWLTVVGVLGGIFVFTAYAVSGGAREGTGRPAPATTAGPVALRRGDCVRSEPGAVEPIECGTAAGYRVVELVAIGRPCPAGSQEVYLPDQHESACLESFPFG